MPPDLDWNAIFGAAARAIARSGPDAIDMDAIAAEAGARARRSRRAFRR